MQEPQRDEDAAGDLHAGEQEISQTPELVVEPKAYAFDGWAMVPLELDLV